MRKIVFLLLAFAIALALVSCSDGTSGHVGYNYGVLTSVSGPEGEADFINKAYEAQFSLIPSATVTDSYVYMDGVYEDTGALILSACALAEQSLEGCVFEGSYEMVLHAVYLKEVESFIYRKSYGKE